MVAAACVLSPTLAWGAIQIDVIRLEEFTKTHADAYRLAGREALRLAELSCERQTVPSISKDASCDIQRFLPEDAQALAVDTRIVNAKTGKIALFSLRKASRLAVAY